MTPKTLLAALLGLAAAAPAFAQNPDVIEREGQKPKREQAQQAEAAESAKQSSTLVAPGVDVTYEQVMANPDNVDLNYRYALVQIKRGELKGASATLERVLMINPSLPKVRLLYAVVLLRLDNLGEAERELNTILANNPPGNIKDEADKYLAEAKKRQKRTQLSGRLSYGLEYDTNRNANPSTDKRLFADTEIQLSGTNERRDDVSHVFMGNFEVHRDLGTQRGHELFAAFNYYRAEQVLLKTLNLEAFSPQVGGVYKSRWADITPSLLFDHIRLAQTSFLRNHGAALRLDKKLNKSLSVWGEFRDEMQEYARTGLLPSAGDRTGLLLEWTGEADCLISPTIRGGLSYNHAIKHASRHFYAYERDGAGVSLVKLLGKGTFAMGSVNVNLDRYDEPDRTLTPAYRRDTIIRADATYGAPLTVLHKGLKDFIFTLTYEYYHALSTIENFAYTNNKVLGMITYKWSLGL